jgi:hypothetical protein
LFYQQPILCLSVRVVGVFFRSPQRSPTARCEYQHPTGQSMFFKLFFTGSCFSKLFTILPNGPATRIPSFPISLFAFANCVFCFHVLICVFLKCCKLFHCEYISRLCLHLLFLNDQDRQRCSQRQNQLTLRAAVKCLSAQSRTKKSLCFTKFKTWNIIVPVCNSPT